MGYGRFTTQDERCTVGVVVNGKIKRVRIISIKRVIDKFNATGTIISSSHLVTNIIKMYCHDENIQYESYNKLGRIIVRRKNG